MNSSVLFAPEYAWYRLITICLFWGILKLHRYPLFCHSYLLFLLWISIYAMNHASTILQFFVATFAMSFVLCCLRGMEYPFLPEYSDWVPFMLFGFLAIHFHNLMKVDDDLWQILLSISFGFLGAFSMHRLLFSYVKL